MTTSPNDMNQSHWNYIFMSWLIAVTSTLGSLFFSEIMDLVPCVLCWYQRIFMFPLSVILLVGLINSDKQVAHYALPLAIIGLIFTLYHCLLFFGFIPENLQPCSQGVSCSDEGMVLFDLVPIPILSLISFILITIFLIKSKVSI